MKHGLLADEWLMDYASGNLSEGKAVVVSSHLSYQPELAAKVAGMEDVAGEMMMEQPPTEMADDGFDQLMTSLDDYRGDIVTESQPITDANKTPAALTAYLDGRDLDSIDWNYMGPGMRYKKLWIGENGEKMWLLKAKAGNQMPVHDHTGLEFTLLLQGGFTSSNGHFETGMMELAGAETEDHAPIIDEGEDCICLVVTDAPIRLHNPVGRMFQKFIGL